MGPSPLSFSAITQDDVLEIGRQKVNGNFNAISTFTNKLATGFTTNLISATTLNVGSVTGDTFTFGTGTTNNFTATNATITSITTTNFSADNLSSDTLAAGSLTFTGGTGTTLSLSSLTSTDLFFTTASGDTAHVKDIFMAGTLSGGTQIIEAITANTANFGHTDTDTIIISGKTLETIFSEFDYKDISWANFQTDYNGSGLTKGSYYRITDRNPENLVLFAVDTHKVGTQAWSLEYPADIIHIDLDVTQSTAGLSGYVETIPTPTPSYDDQGVKIVYRKDTVNNIEAYYDWRKVRFRRWFATGKTNTETAVGYISWSTAVSNNDIGSSDTEINVDNGDTLDVYTFGSESPTNVKNVSVGKHTTKELNNIVFLGSSQIENVIVDSDCSNISFSGTVKNVKLGSGSQGSILKDNFEDNIIHGNFTNNIVFTDVKRNVFGFNFKFNSVGQNSVENTFATNVTQNTFNQEFEGNVVGDNFNSNRLGQASKENYFGDRFDDNEIDVNFRRNEVGTNVRNTVVGSNMTGSTFGDNLFQNTIGNNCGISYFGDSVTNITIGDSCLGTKIMGHASNIVISANSKYNQIGEFASNNTIDGNSDWNIIGRNSTDNSIGSNSDWNKIGDNADQNAIGDNCTYNEIGSASNQNTIGDNAERNTLGYNTLSNTIGASCIGCDIGDKGQQNTIAQGSVEVELVRDCRDVVFGANSKYVSVYHNYDQKTSQILYDIDYTTSGTVEYKRFESGFSNFEKTFSVAAAGTDINLSSFGKYGYLGVVGISSVATAMTKNRIIGAPQDHDFKLEARFGNTTDLELTLQSSSPTTTTSGQMVLDTSSVTLDSNRKDFIVFKADENGVLREQYRQIN